MPYCEDLKVSTEYLTLVAGHSVRDRSDPDHVVQFDVRTHHNDPQQVRTKNNLALSSTKQGSDPLNGVSQPKRWRYQEVEWG